MSARGAFGALTGFLTLMAMILGVLVIAGAILWIVKAILWVLAIAAALAALAALAVGVLWLLAKWEEYRAATFYARRNARVLRRRRLVGMRRRLAAHLRPPYS